MARQIIFDACFFFGWSSSLDPFNVDGSHIVYINTNHNPNLIPTVSEYRRLSIHLREQRSQHQQQKQQDRITLFNDVNNNYQTRLSSTWKIYESHSHPEGINVEQVNSNTCFYKPGLLGIGSSTRSLLCLPAFYIVGFEKCGTTALNIWLSYHPNLKANWMEGRYFDQPNLTLQDQRWYTDYLPQLPTIDIATELGKVWTFEKSPAYSINPSAANAMSQIVPDAKILFLTRNPTDRAYSLFTMYTHHHLGIKQAIRQKLQPVSFFVQNQRNLEVHYIKDPGIGGTVVPSQYIPVNVENDTWTYLEYPPSPEDFHRYVSRMIQYYQDPINYQEMMKFQHQGRGQRVLSGGLYGDILTTLWLPKFSSNQLILLPSETFFDNNHVLQNIDALQQLLGIPHFDYIDIVSNITTTTGGRMEIKSSLGTILNQNFNNNYKDDVRLEKQEQSSNHHHHHQMKPETKKLLDDFYCELNRRLLNLLVGSTDGQNSNKIRRSILRGYACGE